MIAHGPKMSQPNFSKGPFHPPIPLCNSTGDNKALTFQNYCSAILMQHTVIMMICVSKKTTCYSTFTYLYPSPPPFTAFCTKPNCTPIKFWYSFFCETVLQHWMYVTQCFEAMKKPHLQGSEVKCRIQKAQKTASCEVRLNIHKTSAMANSPHPVLVKRKYLPLNPAITSMNHSKSLVYFPFALHTW